MHRRPPARQASASGESEPEPRDAGASERRRRLRVLGYAVLITLAAGSTAGRLASVKGVQGSNDRSRWLAVRALVEHGSYVIGTREPTAAGGYRDEGLIAEPEWDTIDKVYNAERGVFASDKLPVLPTVVAPAYWLLTELGWDFRTDERAIVVTILFLINWLPFVVYLVLLARLVERLGTTDWGRLFVVAAGCFATFVPTFAATFTNHTIAAFSCMYALYFVVRMWLEERVRWWQPALAGLFAGGTLCNALPALLFVPPVGLALAARFSPKTLAWFAFGAAVPVLAFATTNYLAYGYVHGWISAGTIVRPAWSVFYEDSYWLQPESLDRREPSRWVYVFHYLIGHHGVLSLSPVFALSWASMLEWGRGWSRGAAWLAALCAVAFAAAYIPFPWNGAVLLGASVAAMAHPWKWWRDPYQSPHVVSRLALGVSCVVVGLLLTTVLNYGGHTAGPRHLLWLTPLWLLAMPWIADRIAASRRWRFVAYAALSLSAFSAAYPGNHPWAHPWIYALVAS